MFWHKTNSKLPNKLYNGSLSSLDVSVWLTSKPSACSVVTWPAFVFFWHGALQHSTYLSRQGTCSKVVLFRVMFSIRLIGIPAHTFLWCFGWSFSCDGRWNQSSWPWGACCASVCSHLSSLYVDVCVCLGFSSMLTRLCVQLSLCVWKITISI